MDSQFPPGHQAPEWPSESWVDPEAERRGARARLLRGRSGFSLLGLALVVYSLSSIYVLIGFVGGPRAPIGAVLGVPNWEFLEQAAVVWGSLLGVALLLGGRPDEGWRRRSGLLLVMCLVDAALWSLDHAADFGLMEGKAGHEWLRHSLGVALGWSEFALIAGLAGELAAHLGEPRAPDFARAVRSLASTGAMLWFMYFYSRTNWAPPLWPLAPRPWNQGTGMLLLGWMVLLTIVLVQVTILCLLAGRCCGRALREMDAEDRASDLLPSRSEAGWDDFRRPDSGPKRDA